MGYRNMAGSRDRQDSAWDRWAPHTHAAGGDGHNSRLKSYYRRCRLNLLGHGGTARTSASACSASLSSSKRSEASRVCRLSIAISASLREPKRPRNSSLDARAEIHCINLQASRAQMAKNQIEYKPVRTSVRSLSRRGRIVLQAELLDPVSRSSA